MGQNQSTLREVPSGPQIIIQEMPGRRIVTISGAIKEASPGSFFGREEEKKEEWMDAEEGLPVVPASPSDSSDSYYTAEEGEEEGGVWGEEEGEGGIPHELRQALLEYHLSMRLIDMLSHFRVHDE